MTFRRFLDVCEALLVEAYQSLPQMNLLAAMEQTHEWSVGTTPAKQEQSPTSKDPVSENDAALAELKGLMKGLQVR